MRMDIRKNHELFPFADSPQSNETDGVESNNAGFQSRLIKIVVANKTDHARTAWLPHEEGSAFSLAAAPLSQLQEQAAPQQHRNFKLARLHTGTGSDTCERTPNISRS